MREYTLEEVKAAAESIMRSWAEANVWPVDEWYPVGTNWKLHLWVEEGARGAVLYELDGNGFAIQQSATWLPVPEVEGVEK